MKKSILFLVSFCIILLIGISWTGPEQLYIHWFGHISRSENPGTILVFDDEGKHPQTLKQGTEHSSGKPRLFYVDGAMTALNRTETAMLAIMDEVVTPTGKTILEGHILLPDNFLGKKIMQEILRTEPEDKPLLIHKSSALKGGPLTIKRPDADDYVTTNYLQFNFADDRQRTGIVYHNTLANPLEGGEFAYMINMVSLRITPSGQPAKYLDLPILHSCVRKKDYAQNPRTVN